MKAAISEVLETMYFTDVGFQAEVSGEAMEGWEACIDVHPVPEGPCWRLRLSFVEGFARELAANMLGMDSEKLDDDQVRDAMQELANMVAGTCMVLLGPENWRLGLPFAEKKLGRASQNGDVLNMASSGSFVGQAACVQG
ncbi:MAG: chemotaxis protein CheX [Desulfosoma sp.]|uniref:chemotaxis protein CheX n=1 Tax=Desulfosoma sp. TaxID=2603217 RepID=UPI00404B151F